MSPFRMTSSLSLAALMLCVGCASSYVTPGGPAPIGEMTTPSVAQRLRLAPEAPLPANLAFVRVQETGYRSWGDGGVNRGNLAIVGPREIERQEHIDAIATWSDIAGVTRLSPMLVPQKSDSLLALREGAASLHADILAVYTVDTLFDVDSHDIGPLGLLSLGLAPTKNARVRSTVTMAFFDVRTGFCYGTAEGGANDSQVANAWTSGDAVDQCRLRVERDAFANMLTKAGQTWAEAATRRKAALDRAARAETAE